MRTKWDIDVESGHLAHPSGLHAYIVDDPAENKQFLRCVGPFSSHVDKLSASDVFRITAEAIAAVQSSDTLKCATCHNSDFAVEKLQKRKTIFHANCKDCHKKEVNGKKGPTKCSGCHVKKKKAVEGC